MSTETPIKIAHLTSVHPRGDTRILVKQCHSLAKAGYEVTLFVADGLGDEKRSGTHIVDLGRPRSRLNRMLGVPRRLYGKVIHGDFKILHLHDPELIPLGLKLKKKGMKVIYDAHEDFPTQILGKYYLNKFFRIVLSRTFRWYQSNACRHFDAIVAATPFIRDQFKPINKNAVDVNNFPILEELGPDNLTTRRSNAVCYVGAIADVRGIEEMVVAMDLVKQDAVLLLGGKFAGSDIEEKVQSYPGWRRVEYLGWLDRKGVRDILNQSVAGLVTLRPLRNYLDSLPVKMFEYMASGLPVIASNFPLWRQIVTSNDCGICVDPLNPREIAEAIDRLIENPDEAERMGKNGIAAVSKIYNWSLEEEKLLALYAEVLST